MAKHTVSLDFIEKNKKGEFYDLETLLFHEVMINSVALIFFHVGLQFHRKFAIKSRSNIVQQGLRRAKKDRQTLINWWWWDWGRWALE